MNSSSPEKWYDSVESYDHIERHRSIALDEFFEPVMVILPLKIKGDRLVFGSPNDVHLDGMFSTTRNQIYVTNVLQIILNK